MIDDIKKLVKSKKAVFGTERTLKELKAGRVKKVYITSTCAEHIKEDIEQYAELGKTEVVQLSIPGDELGVVCKKQFSISVISELKEQ